MRLMLIGCGRMGWPLLHSWCTHNPCIEMVVVQPSLSAAHHFCSDTVHFFKDLSDVPAYFKADVLVLAMRPQQHHLLCAWNQRVGPLVISLLAHTPISVLSPYFPSETAFVRLIPNLGVLAQRSMHLVYASPELNTHHDTCVHQLFDPLGRLMILKNEQLLDQLTAVSGSGVAYFLLLAQFLEQEATRMGLDPETARVVVQETLMGSAAVAALPGTYEKKITDIATPGGVTEAALSVLRPAFAQALPCALKKATTTDVH